LACAMPRTAGPPFIASRANTVLSQSVSQSCAAGPVPSLVPSPPSLAGHARNLDRSERARGTRHVQQPPVTIGKLTAVLYRWVVICLWQVPRHAFGLYTMHVGGASWMHLGPPQHCSVFPSRASHDLILQRRPKAPSRPRLGPSATVVQNRLHGEGSQMHCSLALLSAQLRPSMQGYALDSPMGSVVGCA